MRGPIAPDPMTRDLVFGVLAIGLVFLLAYTAA
jgi:hypothetical protein